jgi:DNA-directed RNA polymerase specialized sigma24 family protein
MLTIAILPEKADSYRALAGDKESTGTTPGEALDALREKLAGGEQGALIIVQDRSPDEFFGAAQQERLAALMSARKAGSLSAEEERELESLVEAELDGARVRTKTIADLAEPEEQTSGAFPYGGPNVSAPWEQGRADDRSFFNFHLPTGAENPRVEEMLAHKEAVYEYALSRTGSPDVAEDLVQDVFASIISRALRHGLEDIKDLKIYMLLTARETLVHMQWEDEQSAGQNIGSVDDVKNKWLRWLGVDNPTSRNLEVHLDRIDLLKRRIFTEREKWVIILYLEGFSYEEIAAHLDVDIKEPLLVMNRIKARLRHLPEPPLRRKSRGRRK